MTQIKSNIPKIRFKEFSGEWEEKKLGDITTSLGGYAFSGDLFGSKGNKLMIPKNFTKSGKAYFSDKNTKYTTEEFDEKYICKSGDLLVLLTDLTPSCELLGNPILLNNSDGESLLNQRILKLSSNNLTTNTFLLYRLLNKSYKKYIKMTCSGSTVRHSSTKIINSYLLNLPQLPEQQKIASFLSSVDEKIENIKEKKKSLEEYKKGVIQKIFKQEIRFKDENGDEFGEWEEKKLGDIATFLKGKGISKADISDDGKIECIRYGELYTNYCETIKSIKSKTNLKENELIFSKKNDVIIPASGETQIDIATASCVLDEGIALGGDLNIIRSINNGIFLAYYLNNRKKLDIARLSQGISVVHLYSSQLKTLNISLPSLPEQQKIADFLSGIDEKIEKVGDELEKVEEFKKGLLQGMFV